MKKIISRYYLFVTILLVIADQFLIRLLLHSDLAAGLSDFAYYLSDYAVEFSCGSACFYFHSRGRKMATN